MISLNEILYLKKILNQVQAAHGSSSRYGTIPLTGLYREMGISGEEFIRSLHLLFLEKHIEIGAASSRRLVLVQNWRSIAPDTTPFHIRLTAKGLAAISEWS